jgi:uncharacterized protein
MSDDRAGNECDLDAGSFSSWLDEMRAALRGERASDVPCGECTACCTSSQFVHVGPEETRTLSCMPAELLFPAPGLPSGHVLLGYDDRGYCPMLVEERCSIYPERPRTCRTYDCRVFPASGVEPEDVKPLIRRQAERWCFSFSTQADCDSYEAVRAAAEFLSEHPSLLPEDIAPRSPTQLAVLAIEIHDLFLNRDQEAGGNAVLDPDPDVVRAEVLRRQERPLR